MQRTSLLNTQAKNPAHNKEKTLPGEEGLWVFVLGDLLVFSLFFATFLFYRGDAVEDYANAQSFLNLALGTTNTLILLTSSFVLASGIKLLRHGNGTKAKLAMGICIALGGIFILGKITEYVEINGQTRGPAEDEFFMFYFVFTGIHLVHVLVGLIALGILSKLTQGLNNSASIIRAAECGGIYWHMVDLLWIILFTLFYLLP